MGWICLHLEEAKLVYLIERRIYHSILARETDLMRTCHRGGQHLRCADCGSAIEEHQLLAAHQPVSLETYPRSRRTFEGNIAEFVCLHI